MNAIRPLLLETMLALADARSVTLSVQTGRDRRVTRDGSVLFLQTEEWCAWVEREVGSKVKDALTRIKAELDSFDSMVSPEDLSKALAQAFQEGQAAAAARANVLTADDFARMQRLLPIVDGGPDCNVTVPAPFLERLINSVDATSAQTSAPGSDPSGAHAAVGWERRTESGDWVSIPPSEIHWWAQRGSAVRTQQPKGDSL